MKLRRCIAGLLLALAIVVSAQSADKEEGFAPLFNGKDLAGWVNVNGAPGTFFVKDGEIITTGKPTGFLRTEKQYENFIAEFEWMHVNKTVVGNSGFFVWGDPLPAVGTPFTRGIEVQVLVNLEKDNAYTSHGDVFSIQGASCKPDRPHPMGWQRCLPSERRCKGGGEWNHYKIVAQDGAIKLHVNGKEVSGVSECKPRKGYLALESEGAECHFRNLKIKELPSTNPDPDDYQQVADVAKGFNNLYFGDLTGWKADDEAKKHWKPSDWRLTYDGKGEGSGRELRSEQEHAVAELIADFRFTNKKDERAERWHLLLQGRKEADLTLGIDPTGDVVTRARLTKDGREVLRDASGPHEGLKPAGQWNRLRVGFYGKEATVVINGKKVVNVDVTGLPAKGAIALRPGSAMEFANVFVREAGK